MEVHVEIHRPPKRCVEFRLTDAERRFWGKTEGGDSDWVELLASQVALDWLRRHALGLPLTDRLIRSQ